MDLTEHVRECCREIAASARSVSIDRERLEAFEAVPAEPPVLDPERHYLEGANEDVTSYLLVLDTINFGSGWFPTLRKRPGCSGYFTVAWALADHYRCRGPLSPAALRSIDSHSVAEMLGQEPEHELIALYASALRSLGEFLGDRSAPVLVREAAGSAERLASMLTSMPFFDDVGFYKRAQIVPNDLALAGIASFTDLDRLTIFADNLVPHVLRLDGILRYDDRLAARIDAGQLLPPGREEREIRACAVHACELLAARTGVPARVLDTWLWNRGQQAEYKARPRHRTRTVFY